MGQRGRDIHGRVGKSHTALQWLVLRFAAMTVGVEEKKSRICVSYLILNWMLTMMIEKFLIVCGEMYMFSF